MRPSKNSGNRFHSPPERGRSGFFIFWPALPFPGGCGILGAVKVTVTHLTDQLLGSYAKVGGINHLDGKNLPSKSAIASITVDLLRLLFPGFFDEKTIHSSELKVETAILMDSVLGRLQDEIYKSLEYSPPEKVGKKTSAMRPGIDQ